MGNPPLRPRGEDGFERDLLLLSTSAYHERASSAQAKMLHTRLLQPAASQTHLCQGCCCQVMAEEREAIYRPSRRGQIQLPISACCQEGLCSPVPLRANSAWQERPSLQ